MVIMVVGGLFFSFPRPEEFLKDAVKLIALTWDTFLLIFLVLFSSAFIAFPMALVQAFYRFRFKGVVELLFVLPLALPSYFSAFCFSSLLSKGGILHKHLPETIYKWIPDIHGLFGAVLVLTSICYPYLYFALKNQLNKFDFSLWQSALLLERSKFKCWIHIALPLILPAASSGMLIIALYGLSDFGAVSIMRYETLTFALYSRLTSALDKEAAAGISLILVFISLAIIFAEGYFHRIRKQYSYLPHERQTKPLLGIKAVVFFTYSVAVIGICLFSPLITLIYWLLSRPSFGQAMFGWQSLVATLFLAGTCGVAIALITYWGIRASQRSGRRLFILAERIQYLGYALPGLVIAFGLIELSLEHASFMYQSFGLLALAYLVHFGPQAVSSLRSSTYLIQPEIEQASHLIQKKQVAGMDKDPPAHGQRPALCRFFPLFYFHPQRIASYHAPCSGWIFLPGYATMVLQRRSDVLRSFHPLYAIIFLRHPAHGPFISFIRS